MNNIAKMELPVSFDSLNDAIVDAKGRTICIVSWPQCGLDVLTIKERANFIVGCVNGVRTEPVYQFNQEKGNTDIFVPKPVETKSIYDSAKESISKIFGKRGRKRIHPIKRAFKWQNADGVEVKVVGRPKAGLVKVYLDKIKVVA